MSGEYGLAAVPEYEPGMEDSQSSEMQVYSLTVIGNSNVFVSFVFVVYYFGDHEHWPRGLMCPREVFYH